MYMKIRLQRPAGFDFVLIYGGHKRLETANRPARPEHLLEIAVKRAGIRRHPCVSAGNSELVLRTLVAQTDEFDAGIGVDIDKVAI